ncbi:MAG: hypothetical protein JW802_05285 [Campylobacterales bacterium]|nr:hypothetical protein [Campylobacterales bacterium]MBN2831977.1 hypothetical protein [Campylobacterales bacterium]
MKTIKLLLLALVPLIFQACVASKNLSNNDVVKTALTKCPGSEMNISMIPSRGPLPDAMAITAIKVGNDGGFSKEFATFIKSDPKNVSVYCPNPDKLEALISHTLSLYQNNELKGISICLIGIENSKELTTEAARTGARLTLVP